MRWRMSHTLHLRASCFVPAFYMSMNSLGEYTLYIYIYGCFLCVGYSLDLGHFGLESFFTALCTVFSRPERILSTARMDSRLSVNGFVSRLVHCRATFDTAQGL